MFRLVNLFNTEKAYWTKWLNKYRHSLHVHVHVPHTLNLNRDLNHTIMPTIGLSKKHTCNQLTSSVQDCLVSFLFATNLLYRSHSMMSMLPTIINCHYQHYLLLSKLPPYLLLMFLINDLPMLYSSQSSAYDFCGFWSRILVSWSIVSILCTPLWLRPIVYTPFSLDF